MLETEKQQNIKPDSVSAILKMIRGEPIFNRYTIAIAMTLVTTLSGPMHFNWSCVSFLLQKMGAFQYMCNPDSTGSAGSFGPDGLCIDQRVAIGKICTLILACQFCFSLISGQLADRISPKLASMSGIICIGLGWILVLVGSESFQSYYFGSVLIGLGQDLSFLPLFIVTKLFPGREATYISAIGTGRSLSSFIPIIIASVTSDSTNPRPIFLGYTFGMMAFCLLAVYLFIPWNHKKPVQDVELSGQPSKNGLKSFFHDNWLIITRMEFLLFVPYAISALMRPTWATLIARDILKQSLPAFEWAAALSFLPCPIFGFLCDKIGIYNVLHIINTNCIAMLFFMVVAIQSGYGEALFAQYIVVVCFGIMQSFVVSQLYCYVSKCFHSNEVGSVIGLYSLMGGLATFFVQNVYEKSQTVGYAPGTWGFFGFSVFAGFIVIVLQLQDIRRKRKLTP